MMRSYHSDDSEDASSAAEAAEWLLRLQDPHPGAEEPYPDPLDRQQAAADWLKQSPKHLRFFLEFMETEHRLRDLLQRIEPFADSKPRTVISGTNGAR